MLEIGTGSGYQAAVLSPLVKDVYTIEIVEPLGKRAARTLKRLEYENVFTHGRRRLPRLARGTRRSTRSSSPARRKKCRSRWSTSCAKAG